MVRLCPPLVFLVPASVVAAPSCGSDGCPRRAGWRERSEASACCPRRALLDGAGGGCSGKPPASSPAYPPIAASSSKDVPLLLAVGVSHSDSGAFSPLSAVLLLALGKAKMGAPCSPAVLALNGSPEGVKTFAWLKLCCASAFDVCLGWSA